MRVGRKNSRKFKVQSTKLKALRGVFFCAKVKGIGFREQGSGDHRAQGNSILSTGAQGVKTNDRHRELSG